MAAKKKASAKDTFMAALWGCMAGKASWRKWAPNAESPIPKTIDRILAAGVKEADLYAVVRYMQAEALYNACQLLDDPTFGADDPGSVKHGWKLVDEAGKPMAEIHALFHAAEPG